MIDIIIVNFNTSKMVIDSIESFYDKLVMPFKIFIVDNNSEKSNFDIIEQYSKDKEKIKIIRLEENIGFGRANNEAIMQSSNPYVYLLNPDTIVLEDAIEILLNYLTEHDDVGVVGSNLYTKKMEPMHSFYRKMPSIKTERENNSLIYRFFRLISGKKRVDFNYSKNPLEVGFVTGASMMIKRTVLEKVGIFDKDFFMYSEEAELSFRIWKAGYKILNIPSSKVIHLEGASFVYNKKNINFQRLDMLNYSRLLLQEKTQQNPNRYAKVYTRLQKKKAIIALLIGNKNKWHLFNADCKSMKNQIKLWNEREKSNN